MINDYIDILSSWIMSLELLVLEDRHLLTAVGDNFYTQVLRLLDFGKYLPNSLENAHYVIKCGARSGSVGGALDWGLNGR